MKLGNFGVFLASLIASCAGDVRGMEEVSDSLAEVRAIEAFVLPPRNVVEDLSAE